MPRALGSLAWPGFKPSSSWVGIDAFKSSELELELIQTQVTQKPMPRAKVYVHESLKDVLTEKEVEYFQPALIGNCP